MDKKTSQENLHIGHRARLRQRALAEGLDGFSQHEVLELILYNAIPYKDTNELSHVLLKDYGSITAVLSAPIEELVKYEDIGETAAQVIKTFPMLARYCREDKLRYQERIETYGQLMQYAINALCDSATEELIILGMDSSFRVLAKTKKKSYVAMSITTTSREVMELCIKSGASYCVIMHSHPSGKTQPSREDDTFTHEIYDMLMCIETKLLDHVIVAGQEIYSYSRDGKLAIWQNEFEYKNHTRSLRQDLGGYKDE